jgi:hypothetical protein
MRRNLSETIRVEMTIKLLISIIVTTLTIGTGTLAWAYSYGDKVIGLANKNTDDQLKGFVSRDEFFKAVDGLKEEQYKTREQVLERINRVLLEVRKR